MTRLSRSTTTKAKALSNVNETRKHRSEQRTVIAEPTSSSMRYFAEVVLRSVHVVSSERVLPFEEPCSPAGVVSMRLDERTSVRHPFPVIRRGKDYLLLDDCLGFASMIRRGVHHIPVQQFSEEAVQPISRQVSVDDIERSELERLVRQYADRCDRLIGGAPRSASDLLIEARFGQANQLEVRIRHEEDGCPAILTDLFRTISEAGRYGTRCPNSPRPETPFRFSDPAGWLNLPAFDLDDLWAAARSDQRFPSGIIEVRLAGRVLNIDFPVAILVSELPREEKDAFLHDLVLFRQQASRTSVLDGPVYLLNR